MPLCNLYYDTTIFPVSSKFSKTRPEISRLNSKTTEKGEVGHEFPSPRGRF